MSPLSQDEAVLVALIRAGYTRARIAEVMDVSDDYVRDLVRELCERLDCRMDKLPDAVKANTRSE